MKMRIMLLTAVVMASALLVLNVFIYLALDAYLTSVDKTNLETKVRSISQLALDHVNNGQVSMNPSDPWLDKYVGDRQTIYLADDQGIIIKTLGEKQRMPSTLPDLHRSGVMVEKLSTRSGKFLYVVAPIVHETSGRMVGYVALTSTMPARTQFMRALALALAIGSAGAVLLVSMAAFGVAVSVLRPLHQMIRTVTNIEVGNLQERVSISARRDEVAELAHAFNRMLGKIDRSFQQQARFVADASHEIRTPLTIIQGYADLLDRWGKHDPKTVEESVSTIRREASRLHKMAKDLLTLSGAQAAVHNEPQKADVDSIVTEVVHSLDPLAKDKQMTLDLESACIANITPDHFRQVCVNLIDNAVKYTPVGGSIQVRTRDGGNDSLILEVEDSGPGMSDEDMLHMFDRFYRSPEARSGSVGGTGLGLAIVKELVDLYGGTVAVRTQLGMGTRLTVTFLCAKS